MNNVSHSYKNFLPQKMRHVSFGIAIIIIMSILFMKFVTWIMEFLPLNTSKVFCLMMGALLVNGFEMKNNSENEFNSFSDSESDDNGYEAAESEILEVFFDADEGVYLDSDSGSFEYQLVEEDTLDDFQDPHQYGLWNPVKKTLAF